MNTYWNNKGKYQEWADEISETMPDMCDTDNKNMNVFIAMTNLYYDIYNNGGGNIEDSYMLEVEIIKRFLGSFDIEKAVANEEYLEGVTNTVFEKLMNEDLSFENHGFWNECKQNLISRNPQDGENWRFISCGTKANMEKEFEDRKQHFRFLEVS
jgi:hypothetical protein